MRSSLNEHGQPIGTALPGWSTRPNPERVVLQGVYCTVEPLHNNHFDDLAQAMGQDQAGQIWTYMAAGPFPRPEDYIDYLKHCSRSSDPLHFAVVDEAKGAVGTVALSAHDPHNGVVEMAWVTYSPVLQRTIAATEAQYLLMKYVFEELGYRRYQWKCDALNQPSRRAAQRLGFTFEGVHRQAIVYKQRSRDTAWYSLIDSEWPSAREALEKWLATENFDAVGQQLQSLSDLRDQQRD